MSKEKANDYCNDIVNINEVLKTWWNAIPDFDRYLSENMKLLFILKRKQCKGNALFKLRGAYYAIHQLSDEARGDVVCASAGLCSRLPHCNEMRIPGNHLMPGNNAFQNGQVRFLRQVCNNQIGGRYLDASAQAAQEYTMSEGMTFS